MIPKKQLEKKIEELGKQTEMREIRIGGKSLGFQPKNRMTFMNNMGKISELKATLTQTNKIIELIEELESFTIDINGKLVGNREPYQSGWSGDWIKKEELLTKIKGGER